MKWFQERNAALIGAIGVAAVTAITVAAYNFNEPAVHLVLDHLHRLFRRSRRSDLRRARAGVRRRRRQVQSIALQPQGVLVTFTVDDHIRLGDRTEAAIKTISVLGNKILDVSPRGDGHLSDTIPLDRTTSPYQLPDAIGDLSATISGLKPTSSPTPCAR